jgi:hypothetical protein
MIPTIAAKGGVSLVRRLVMMVVCMACEADDLKCSSGVFHPFAFWGKPIPAAAAKAKE